MKKRQLQAITVMLGVIFFSLGSDAFACDLCAIYSAQNIKDSQGGAVTLGATEQFSSFHSVRLDGDYFPNEAHQSLSSSITQFYGQYDFTDEVGIQLNLPFINRDFKRLEEGEIQKGNESGLGDIAILASYSPLRISEGDFFARVSVRGGLKLPTGDSDRIREETEEGHEDAHIDENHTDENGHIHTLAHSGHHDEDHHDETETTVPSAIHGHDLALGSGSIDYVVGTTGFIEKGMYFAIVDLQYLFRTEGDFNYRYDNDLMWSVGAGRYLFAEHESSVSLKANLSGEYKGKDVFEGNKVDDTGINSMYLGPEIGFTIGESLAGLLAVDLPVILDTTGFQSVPDYRLRFGITYRF